MASQQKTRQNEYMFFHIYHFALVVGDLAGWTVHECLQQANETYRWILQDVFENREMKASLSPEAFGTEQGHFFRYAVLFPAFVRLCRNANVLHRLPEAYLAAGRFAETGQAGIQDSVFQSSAFWNRMGQGLDSLDPNQTAILLRFTSLLRTTAHGDREAAMRMVADEMGLSTDEAREAFMEAVKHLIDKGGFKSV